MDIAGAVGELRFTLEVSKKTGEKRVVDLVGFVDQEKLEELRNEWQSRTQPQQETQQPTQLRP